MPCSSFSPSALMYLFRDKWAGPGGMEDWGYFCCSLPGSGDRCDPNLYRQMSWQKQVVNTGFSEPNIREQSFKRFIFTSTPHLANIISWSLPSIDIILEGWATLYIQETSITTLILLVSFFIFYMFEINLERKKKKKKSYILCFSLAQSLKKQTPFLSLFFMNGNL